MTDWHLAAAGVAASRLPALSVSVADDGDAGAWDSFVTSLPEGGSYHLWGWRGVFQRAFGLEPVYLTVRRGPVVRAVLPLVQVNSLLFGRSLTSLPFLNYGGVAAAEDEAAEVIVGAAAAIGAARRCRYVELRHLARRVPALPCKQHKVTMLLRLADARWTLLDRKVRNQVRKAHKSGLVVKRGGPGLLGDFYSVFARNMRDLGTPVHGRRFFEEVLRAFPERTRVHVVSLGDEPVSAGVTYRMRNTVMVPWASSIRTYNALCPNHLLYWDIIEQAMAEDYEILDFGRSTPLGGTYRFKEQWGARPVPLHWEYCFITPQRIPDTSSGNETFRFMIEVWKRLPVAVASRFGPPIARMIP